ncbi:MAG: TIM barrel protein, partial [Bacteroidales bacterium]|nr:TIM barrel protein [Bacteroidales bacterium]
MRRKTFIKTLGTGITVIQLAPLVLSGHERDQSSVRLGGPVFGPYDEPEQWINLLKTSGYRAAYCPVNPGADEQLIKAYEHAARKHDVVISEVGAWSNPISPDRAEAEKAIHMCIAGLQLADQIGARCCVNISGSRNPDYWAGPHEENLTKGVFDQVVEVTRKIIDAVKPQRSFFALEAMPWSFPDSTETYLQLLKAIDRSQFGVHLDPVNMIASVRDYFNNGKLIREMFAKLGSHIRSCHAKDITLREDNYIPQLDELRAGLGNLNYAVYLRELAKLMDVPLMMEHLDTAEEYELAAKHIRSVGKSNAISL